MADIIAANLLTPSFITKTVRQFVMNQDNVLGSGILPVVETTKRKLKIRITKNQAVPTEPVSKGAASNSKQMQGSNYITYDPIDYRDKFPIEGDQYLAMLEYQEGFRNTPADSEAFVTLQAKGKELLKGFVEEIGLAIISSLEKNRWEALSGTITYSALGITLDYNFDSGRKPTAAILWSLPGTAVPVQNIKAWKLLYRGSGFRPKKVYMNQATFDEFSETDEVKGYMTGTNSSVLLMLDGTITRVLGLDIVVYDEGYINSSGTFIPFIPNDKVIIVGEPSVGSPAIGEFTQAPSEYNGLQPGMFVRLTHDEDGDPPSFEIIGGFKGIPALYFDDGDAVVYASV